MPTAPATSVDFLDGVRKSGLVEADKLESYLRDNPIALDVEKAAAQLIREGFITSFHAQHLLSGRYKGFILGQYKVLKQIGVGGMGVIFLAEHATLRRKVALKVLPASKVKNQECLERFYREARVVAALDHPNVVRAYDANQSAGMHFLVMEFIDGESLEQKIRREGALSVELAANYICQAAAGLQHGHERGLVHRDIKPGNILLDGQGVVKVLDMGLALFFDDEMDSLTKDFSDGAVLGTADFISPEQALNSHEVDIRADIYSLGVTFYALLNGKPPYAENTVTQKLLAHQMKAAPPIRSVRPDVPQELSDIIEKMMAKKPEDRYQTPGELLEVLTPWAGQTMPASATTLTPPSSSRMKAVAVEKRGRAKLFIAIGLFPILGGLALAYAAGAFKGAPSKSDVAAENMPSENKTIENKPTEPNKKTPAVVPEPKKTDVAAKSEAAKPATEAVAETKFNPLKDQLHRLALSANGKWLFVGSLKGKASIWNLEKNQKLIDLKGHTDRVCFGAFDPAGKKIATASSDGTVRIWEVATGAELKQFPPLGPKIHPWCVAFSPGGAVLASSYSDGSVRIRDTASGDIIRDLPQLPKDVNWLAFDPSGRSLWLACWDGTTRQYDWRSGEEISSQKPGTGSDHENAVAVTPDGRFAVSCGVGRLSIFDAATGYELRRAADPQIKTLYALAVSPDSQLAAAAGIDKIVRVWRIDTATLVAKFTEHENQITGLAFSPDSKKLYSSSYDQTVRVWDLPESAPPPPADPAAAIEGVRLDEALMTAISPVRDVLSPNGNLLLVTTRVGPPVLIEPVSGKLLREFKGHTKETWQGSFDGTGRLCATPGTDGTVRIWDTITGKEKRKIESTGKIWSCLLSSDGKKLFYGKLKGECRIVDLEESKPDIELIGHTNDVNWAAWSPDQKTIYTASWDGTVRGWDAATGLSKMVYQANANQKEYKFSCIDVSSDGSRLLVGGNGSLIFLIDAKTGSLEKRIENAAEVKNSSIHTVAYSPNGRYFVSGGSDKCLTIWDAKTNEKILVLKGPEGSVTGACFSHDGRVIYSASQDKSLRVWNLPALP